MITTVRLVIASITSHNYLSFFFFFFWWDFRCILLKTSKYIINIYIFYFIFIYLWLFWVFVSVLGLSPVAASGGHSSSRCAGLSLSRPLLLRSTGSRRTGSVIVAHGLSRSAACGILPDQGSNPCSPHWQADSQPLRHQGSPKYFSLWRKSPFSDFICSINLYWTFRKHLTTHMHVNIK